MPRVEHDFEHLGADFPGPNQFLDRILERLDAFTSHATDGNSGWRICHQFRRQSQPARQIDFVENDQPFAPSKLLEKMFVSVSERLRSIEHLEDELRTLKTLVTAANTFLLD